MNLPSTEELKKAFKAIEKHDLKINTIICTVCGCLVSIRDKNVPCEHLKELSFEKG